MQITGSPGSPIPPRLRQILRNLVTNAHRYGGETASIAVRRLGSAAVIEVSDDGDGIPAELVERVFEPYETAHRATRVAGSVGLGLTVSRELARLMGGDLTYHRTGSGTTFRLTLLADAGEEARLVS
jgi:signal transduction histidine kinase